MQTTRHESRLQLGACLLLAAAAALAGCASAERTAARVSSPSDDEGRWLRFTCDSGHAVQARYAPDGGTVTVRRDGREYLMRIARSASGARYADTNLEWWTKGSGAGASGMLLAHRSDGSPGELLDSCVEQ